MNLTQGQALYMQGLAQLQAAPPQHTFVDRLATDLKQSTVGLFAGLGNLGYGGVHDVMHAGGLAGGNYLTPSNLTALSQGFTQSSPLPALLAGHPVEAAHRWWERPFSGSLDLLGAGVGGTNALLRGGRTLAETGALPLAMQDQVMGMGGYRRVLGELPDIRTRSQFSLEPTIQMAHDAPDSPSRLVEYQTSVEHPAVSIGDDTYLRRSNRLLYGSDIHNVDPEAVPAIDKLVDDSPIGASLRARNELVARLGDKVSSMYDRVVPDSSHLLGRIGKMARRTVRSTRNMTQADVDSARAQHGDQLATLLGDNVDDPHARNLAGIAHWMDGAGVREGDEAHALDFFADRHRSALTRDSGQLIDVDEMRRRINNADLGVGHDAGTLFDSIVGEGQVEPLPLSDYLQRLHETWAGEHKPTWWHDRFGMLARMPIPVGDVKLTPALDEAKAADGTLLRQKDALRDMLDGTVKSAHDNSLSHVPAFSTIKEGQPTGNALTNWYSTMRSQDAIEKAKAGHLMVVEHPYARELRYTVTGKPEVMTRAEAVAKAADSIMANTHTRVDANANVHLNVGPGRAMPAPIHDDHLEQLRAPNGDLPHMANLASHETYAAREPLERAVQVVSSLFKTQGKSHEAMRETLARTLGKHWDNSSMSVRTAIDTAGDWVEANRAKLGKLRDLPDNARSLTNHDLHATADALGKVSPKLMKLLAGDDYAAHVKRLDDANYGADLLEQELAKHDPVTRDRIMALHAPHSRQARGSIERYLLELTDGLDRVTESSLVDRYKDHEGHLSNTVQMLANRAKRGAQSVDELEKAYLPTHLIDWDALNKWDGKTYPSAVPDLEPGHVRWIDQAKQLLPELQALRSSDEWQRYIDWHRNVRTMDIEATARPLYAEQLGEDGIELGRGRMARYLSGLQHALADDHTTMRMPELETIANQVAAKGGPELDVERMRYVPMDRIPDGEVVSARLKDRRAAQELGDEGAATPWEGNPDRMFYRGQAHTDPDTYMLRHVSLLDNLMHRQLAEAFQGAAIKLRVGEAMGYYLGTDPQGKSLLGADGLPLAKGSLLNAAEATDPVGKSSPFVIYDSSDPVFRAMSIQAGFAHQLADMLHESGKFNLASELRQMVDHMGLPEGELMDAKNSGRITLDTLEAIRRNEKEMDDKAEVYVLPRVYYDTIRQESARANEALNLALRKYGDVWKVAVLHGRFPGWFRNNFLGSSLLLTIASDPAAALGALKRTTEAFVKNNPEQMKYLELLRHELPRVGTATGSAEQARLRTDVTGGHVQGVVNALNRFNAKWADEPFRLGRAHQVLDELAQQYMAETGETPDSMLELHRRLLQDPNVRRLVTEKTLGDMIDFTNLGQRERDYVATMIPFYSWLKGSVGVGLRLLIDRPATAATMAHLSQTGYDQTEQLVGDAAAEYTKSGYVLPAPVQHFLAEHGIGDGQFPTEVSTLGMNPLESPAAVASQALQWLPLPRSMGGASYRGTGSESVMSNFNPAIVGGIAAVTGTDPFFGTPLPPHQSAGYSFVQQAIHGTPIVTQLSNLIAALSGHQKPAAMQVTDPGLMLAQMGGLGTRELRPSAAYARGLKERQQLYGATIEAPH